MENSNVEMFDPNKYLAFTEDGRPFLPLKWVIAWFYSEHPNGAIVVTMEPVQNNNTAIARCEVYFDAAQPRPNGVDYGSAPLLYWENNTIMDDFKLKGNECAATNAKRRALFNAGYGLYETLTTEGEPAVTPSFGEINIEQASPQKQGESERILPEVDLEAIYATLMATDDIPAESIVPEKTHAEEALPLVTNALYSDKESATSSVAEDEDAKLESEIVEEPKKRRRRTKAEMEALRAAQAKNSEGVEENDSGSGNNLTYDNAQELLPATEPAEEAVQVEASEPKEVSELIVEVEPEEDNPELAGLLAQEVHTGAFSGMTFGSILARKDGAMFLQAFTRLPAKDEATAKDIETAKAILSIVL